MTTQITSVVNTPSAEIASKTFVASTYMPLSGGTFTGGVKMPYSAKTGTYTITTLDYIVECTVNSFTVTLPTAVGIAGQSFTIKNSGTGAITVNTTSSQTIDGQLTQTLNQYDSLTVVSNGTNYIII